MVDSAQYRTKVYLTGYWTASNVKEVDTVTTATGIFAVDLPDYPITAVFIDKSVDYVVSIGQPNSNAIIDSDHYPIGYRERVPITVYCIDKSTVVAINLLQQVEAELRAITEANPIASLRRVTGIVPETERLGQFILWSVKYTLDYVRDKT